jgi:inosine-uridine nucleoside N-ribohydrolase
MEARMAGEGPTEAVTADHDIREALATIQDQSRQTLELLRTLIGFLLPIVGDREGPPLEDLIATLVAQNRDLLTIVRRIQADVRVIADRLPAGVSPDPNGQREERGPARS